jgi:Domain of unknown function (DUF5658)
MLKIWCARCGQAYELSPGLAAKRVKCKVCGHIQPIPKQRVYDVLEPVEASEQTTYAVEPAAAVRPANIAAPPNRPAPRLELATHWWDRLTAPAKAPSHLHGFGIALIAVSVADLLMTFLLLRTSHTFYESNPVAQWFFHRWNMAGMTFFKFSVLGIVIVLAEIIERRRPRWGKAVLAVGCVAAGFAFTHGLRLYLGFGGEPLGEAG